MARKHLDGAVELPIAVTPADLHDYLGEAHWLEDRIPSRATVGQSLGLAYTSDGGEVLTIEASISKGRGELVLTGQLGEVMQESAVGRLGLHPRQRGAGPAAVADRVAGRSTARPKG